MKFSIVTISYNQAEYLERALQSVINQQGDFELEYIIVDAGSTDNSRQIIKSKANQVKNIIFEPDEGPADGLNKGFSYATGDIYGYLNADDELIPGALQEVAEYFMAHPDIDVVSAHGEIIDGQDNFLQKCFSHKFNLQRYAEGNCVLVQQSTFFKANIFKSTQGFNKNNRVSWDGELMVDMALNQAKFSRLHRYWSRFRVYNDSISGSGAFLDKASKEHERIAHKAVGSNSVKLHNKLNWLISRLSDPILLFIRIKDGLQNGRRIIPS